MRAGGPRHLLIPAAEAKNAKDLEFVLPADVSRLIDTYLERVRPFLVGEFTEYLFPRRSGGAKTPAQLAEQIERAIAMPCGLDFNVHAFRHLAAKLFLQRHPGKYATVQLLLGHKSIETTIRSYCGLEQNDAFREEFRTPVGVRKSRRNEPAGRSTGGRYGELWLEGCLGALGCCSIVA